jgi:hypothetical protein
LSSTLAARLRTLAICWIPAAAVIYLLDLLRQTRDGLSDGAGRPFGDDFINFFSGPYLAWHGQAATVYDWNGFHAFEVSVAGPSLGFYHYSYPPTLLVLTAPLAFIGYIPGFAAWMLGGWFSFYRALRAAAPNGPALLLSLATPAVFINFVNGQNGTWNAALFGGGLALLARLPTIAGILFGLLIYKPQLGVLLPIALLAGRNWRAFAAATVTAIVVTAVSVLLYGTELWVAYIHHATVLRQAVLESGVGVWHRMISVFVAARRLGAEPAAAYVVQAVVAVPVIIIVALAWFRDAPPAAKYALLVLGTCLVTPYLQDYDLVIGAFVVVWLAELYPEWPMSVVVSVGLVLILPFVAAALANLTGYAFGPLFIAPAFIVAARAALMPKR